MGEFFLELFGDLLTVAFISKLLGGLDDGDLGVLGRLGVGGVSVVGLCLTEDVFSSAIVTFFATSGDLACKLVLRACGVTGETAEEGRLRVGVVGGGLGSGGLDFVSMKLGRFATLEDFIYRNTIIR